MANKHLLVNCKDSNVYTYEDAKRFQGNFIIESNVYQAYDTTLRTLWKKKPEICNVIAQHLHLDSECHVRICDASRVRRGFNNIVIFFEITNSSIQSGVIRFAIPGSVGSEANLVAKVNQEAATYLHLYQEHPDVPKPQLFGFGLSTGKTVRTSRRLSVY